MLDMINDRSGDINFEVQLFDHLWDFFELDLSGYVPSSTQARRSMKNGIGRSVSRDDVREVAGGVRRSPDDQR